MKKHQSRAVLLLVGLLLFATGRREARAQQFTSTTIDPYGAGTNTRFWYWNFADPYGSHLFGASAVIRAEGQYMKDVQQVYLMREQVRSAKLDNKRKAQEQWLWERENLPTPEEERQRLNSQQLLRSRSDPPITEIWSAKALNDLLTDAVKIQDVGSAAGASALPADILPRINVTSGFGAGNLELLRSGKISWPLLLRRKDYTRERERLDQLAALAVGQAGRGEPIAAETLEELSAKSRDLREHLVEQAKKLGAKATWTTPAYLDARRFLDHLVDATGVLQQPDVADHFRGRYVLSTQAESIRTVGDLVKHMRKNGLLFAAATRGNETAYTALYNYLRDYDVHSGTPLERKKSQLKTQQPDERRP